MQLSNQVALITGGTHGIGAATAICLASEGVNICVVARHQTGKSLENKIRSYGVKYYPIIANLSKSEECFRVIDEAVAYFGSMGILVHCAGSAAPGGLLTGAKESWYEAFDIHVHAVFHLCRAVVPVMQTNRSGAILLISSAAGLRGVKNALAYATVKGALPQFTRAIAFELAAFNIRVNCVSPGVIRTRFQDFLTEEQVKNNVENRIPLGKEGKAADVADVICMLIKNEFIRDYRIDKAIVALLDDKYPVLSIRVEKTSTAVGLAITDKKSELSFSLPDQPFSNSLVNFLEVTKFEEKISIVLGYTSGETLVFDKNVTNNVLLVLDGYVFE